MEHEWRKRLRGLVGGPGQPTMKKLSLDAGLGETYVRDVLERDRVPTIDKLQKIANVLGTTVTRLIGEDDGEETFVPVLSWVSAGQLAEGESTPSGEGKTIPVAGLSRGDYFALRVVGDSMDRYSPEGSFIIVNRAETKLVPGKPFVFGLRGEATYKLWRPGPPPRLAPYSTNPANEPIFPDQKRKVFVVGRVRRTILDL